MIDLGPNIYTALTTDSTLSNLIGGRVFFFHPKDFTILPCISYREQSNVADFFIDDTEVGSEIYFAIDVWSKKDPAAIAKEADRIMKSIGFNRVSCSVLHENDTGIYHKAMLYRTNEIEQEE